MLVSFTTLSLLSLKLVCIANFDLNINNMFDSINTSVSMNAFGALTKFLVSFFIGMKILVKVEDPQSFSVYLFLIN